MHTLEKYLAASSGVRTPAACASDACDWAQVLRLEMYSSKFCFCAVVCADTDQGTIASAITITVLNGPLCSAGGLSAAVSKSEILVGSKIRPMLPAITDIQRPLGHVRSLRGDCSRIFLKRRRSVLPCSPIDYLRLEHRAVGPKRPCLYVRVHSRHFGNRSTTSVLPQ
jgi:hypothetical protein